jgi:hypothetical protein
MVKIGLFSQGSALCKSLTHLISCSIVLPVNAQISSNSSELRMMSRRSASNQPELRAQQTSKPTAVTNRGRRPANSP